MIFCSDFLLCSESKPYGDRREVVGSPHTLSGNRKDLRYGLAIFRNL